MDTTGAWSEMTEKLVGFTIFFMYSSEFEILCLQVLKCYINPIIAILGLTANALSMAIVWRSGLQKPSNILLIELAMADSMAMFFSINVSEILQFFDSRKKYSDLAGWQYDQRTAFFLYLVKSLFYFIGNWGAYVNTSIPVLITVERLVVLFYPMTFRKYITVSFAVYSVVLSFVFWLFWSVFCQYLIPFDYVRISNDTQMGIWKLSNYYQRNKDVIVLFNTYIFDCISSWVPVGFVCVGCLVMWIKVQITLANRRNLSSTQNVVKISTRTTKTLVATCLVFASTHILYSTVMYIFNPDLFMRDAIPVGLIIETMYTNKQSRPTQVITQ
ncbi:hypothetical protein Btru_070538 [Bulinus truncatus]|nr:hypothetical protein Btru_070538 [Bulinus truncatus]